MIIGFLKVVQQIILALLWHIFYTTNLLIHITQPNGQQAKVMNIGFVKYQMLWFLIMCFMFLIFNLISFQSINWPLSFKTLFFLHPQIAYLFPFHLFHRTIWWSILRSLVILTMVCIMLTLLLNQTNIIFQLLFCQQNAWHLPVCTSDTILLNCGTSDTVLFSCLNVPHCTQSCCL